MLKLSLLTTVFLAVVPASLAQSETTSSPSSRILCLTCRKPVPGMVERKTVTGQKLDTFEPWIAHLCGGTKPVILQTPRSTLVATLEGGPVDSLSDEEVAALRAAFPSLPAGTPTTLDAHQQAHLLAVRLLKIEDDLRTLLALDEGGRVRPEAGPYSPLASDHVELFAFGQKGGYEAFTAFLFEKDVWPLGGVLFDWGPTGAVLTPNLKEPAARRQFAFMSAMQLLRGLSRAGAGLQGWLQVGLSHAIEDRHAAKGPRPPGATLPPSAEAPKDWDSFVGDMVAGGKVGDLGALAATPASALSVRSRLQSWSMARWMIDLDRKKLAEMVRHLLHSAPSETPQKALLGAMRPAWAHDMVSLTDEWKKAVAKRPAASK
jgi:hypothetical protein